MEAPEERGWLLEFHVLAKSKVISGSYQVYQIGTALAHDDFIVLPHWQIRLLASCPNIIFSDIILTLSPPYPINAERQARK